MVSIQTSQRITPKLKQIQKLMAKIKLANVMSLSEDKFNTLIKELEEDFLFRKLMYSEDSKERVLRYKSFPRGSVSSGFYGLKEEIMTDRKSGGADYINIDSMLEERKGVAKLIRSIGEEKFRKHFLNNDENLSQQEISKRCGVEEAEARRIIELLNTIDIYNAFRNSSLQDDGFKKKYSKIAAIKKIPSGGGKSGDKFTIEFFFISYTRGKYLIDYDKLELMKKKKQFSRDELKNLHELIRTMELINAKKSTVYSIIEKIIEKQCAYLESGESGDLVSFTEKQMAADLGVDCSVISRAISSRSIETPWGVEKSLKGFFPSRKNVRKELIYSIINNESVSQTDNEIKDILSREYDINISRRSVASCRLEMDLPSNYRRKKGEGG